MDFNEVHHFFALKMMLKTMLHSSFFNHKIAYAHVVYCSFLPYLISNILSSSNLKKNESMFNLISHYVPTELSLAHNRFPLIATLFVCYWYPYHCAKQTNKCIDKQSVQCISPPGNWTQTLSNKHTSSWLAGTMFERIDKQLHDRRKSTRKNWDQS